MGRFAVAAGLVLIVGLGGCSSHKNDAGQQYADALMRGNAAQASSIWLHMTPKERLQFQRGQGAKAAASRAELKAALQKQLSTGEGGNVGEGGNIEEVMPNLGGGSLRDLPAYSNPTNAPAPDVAH